MSLTYTVADFADSDTTVQVTYTNEAGGVHTRDLRIPRTSEGTIDQELWNQILEEQFIGLKRKIEVGAIRFVDPEVTEDIPNTEQDASVN